MVPTNPYYSLVRETGVVFICFLKSFVCIFDCVGLRCCKRAVPQFQWRGELPSVVVPGLLSVRLLLLRSVGSRRMGFSSCTRVVTHKLFPEEGSNLCPLHWQTDSYLLYLQGSPKSYLHLLMTNQKVRAGYDTSPSSHSLPGAEQARNLWPVLLDHTESQVL